MRTPDERLVARSIEIIRSNQSDSGAFIACPNFQNYRYSWLRDGSFIAYAMVRYGMVESAVRFLRWCAATIEREQAGVDALVAMLESGGVPVAGNFLPARYALDGSRVDDSWPAFQPDGYGAFLWCLGEYVRITGDAGLAGELQSTVATTVRYLELVIGLPSYDCWEEHGDRIHPATIACVSGGLAAAADVLGHSEALLPAGKAKASLLMQTAGSATIPKFIGNSAVDASLLWLSVPFGLLAPDDPLMERTIAAIESDLLVGGGVKRYTEDTYYGGGLWLLLSAWLGWYYLKVGRTEEASHQLGWIESQAADTGEMPEQVLSQVNSPPHVGEWTDRWGAVASPLLWSHAMYLVLADELVTHSRRESDTIL